MFGLFIGFIVIAAVWGEELRFSKSPQDASVVTGKEVTLPCEVTPGEGVTYHWELNGKPISNTTRRFQMGDGGLHITRSDRERDSGQFTCTARDSFGLAVTSPAVSLTIHWIEEPEVQLQSPESASYIAAGKEVILRCHDEASGDVHYEWFRNADRLVKSDRFEIKKKRLHIKSANTSDNGIYKCIAKNEAGIKESNKNFALSVSGPQTPTIEIVPSNQLIVPGGTAFFHCSYKHADVIEWYFKETGPLETKGRHTFNKKNGTLRLDNVEAGDAGLYNCVGIRGESTEVPQSYAAELKLAYIDQFTSASFEPMWKDNLSGDGHVIVGEHSHFQLTCLQPNSLPPAKKFWMNQFGHTISDSGKVKVDDDGRLIIENVLHENAGKYICVAENFAGKTERSVNIIVTSKPKITENPQSITVEENDKSVLNCGVETRNSSKDHNVIRWRKDGKLIKGNNESVNQRMRISRPNGTLTISSTYAEDRGEYHCEVVTSGFDQPIVSKPATITVIEVLKFAPAPADKKLELGSMAKVHCKAQGTPVPLVRWRKVQTGDGALAAHISDVNGTLHFNGVMTSDRGAYLCTATSTQGVINATVHIDVVVSPKFSILTKNTTEAIEGQPVFIDCIAEGDPKPTIQWDKNLKMSDFDKARFTVMENGSLFISDVHRDDENIYGCTAGSSAGLNRKEIHLLVHPKDGYHPPIENEGSTVTKAVLITMSVAAAYIILVVGLMVWCRIRRRSRKLPITEAIKIENGGGDNPLSPDHTELKDTTTTTPVAANGHPSQPNGTTTDKKSGGSSGQRSDCADGAETTHSLSSAGDGSATAQVGKRTPQSRSYEKLQLSRSLLKETRVIGRGEFGDVLTGRLPKNAVQEKRNSGPTTSSSEENNKELYVMVKSLQHTKDENTLAEFKREIDLFNKVSHENITKLYGLCREEEPHYLILEYTDWGDLKHFLVATQTGKSPPLTPVQSVAIVHQVARAMDQLTNARFVHRDLAARNCLVTSKLLVKVSLARLSRDPYSQEYCKHRGSVIPLRWLPHEAVYEDDYSARTDVYAFGVFVWELFHQGELPFPKLNDTSVLARLKDKALEWRGHKDTPPELLKLQEACLDINPQNRPTFSNLVNEIDAVLKSM